jgi:hypothetical protein
LACPWPLSRRRGGPAAGRGTLEALAREARALGIPHSRRVHGAVRASYGSYYHRMMPRLLAALDFRSNNGAHRPVLDALAAIRRAEGAGRQYFGADEIAVEGVMRPGASSTRRSPPAIRASGARARRPAPPTASTSAPSTRTS